MESKHTTIVYHAQKENSARPPVSLMIALLATSVSKNLMPTDLISKIRLMLAPSVTTAQKVPNHRSSVPSALSPTQLQPSRRVSAQCVSPASSATTTVESLRAALKVLTAPLLVSNLPTVLRELSNPLPTRAELMTADHVSVVTIVTRQVLEIF
jgi:hypothetical protein